MNLSVFSLFKTGTEPIYFKKIPLKNHDILKLVCYLLIQFTCKKMGQPFLNVRKDLNGHH